MSDDVRIHTTDSTKVWLHGATELPPDCAFTTVYWNVCLQSTRLTQVPGFDYAMYTLDIRLTMQRVYDMVIGSSQEKVTRIIIFELLPPNDINHPVWFLPTIKWNILEYRVKHQLMMYSVIGNASFRGLIYLPNAIDLFIYLPTPDSWLTAKYK